jgi:hypothetical protein
MIENTFDPDQLIVIAQWLEEKENAGYSLSELIDEFTGRTADNLSV